MSNLSHSKTLIWKTFSQNTYQKCNCLRMFFKIGLLINFPIFARKYLCWTLFLIKLHASWPATLSKKRPQHWCFPVNNTKCLRTAFFMEHLGWLLLEKCLYRRIYKRERFVSQFFLPCKPMLILLNSRNYWCGHRINQRISNSLWVPVFTVLAMSNRKKTSLCLLFQWIYHSLQCFPNI